MGIPRNCRFCNQGVEAPAEEERNRFRLRGRDVCLACDAERFPATPPRSAGPRCRCGNPLRLELGPGLHGAVVVSAYCGACDELTMPYVGPMPPELKSRFQVLRRRARPASCVGPVTGP